MAKTWVLDTDTKGTGAQMRPLEDVVEQPGEQERKRQARRPAERPAPRPRKPQANKKTTASPLAPGQVRKKSTGEIGKLQSVDPRAGTAVVRWLRSGQTSTVPLTAVSRR